jgi:hypothetical protein
MPFLPARIGFEHLARRAIPANDAMGSVDSQLVGALATYLDAARDKEAIRRAIAEWSHDVAHHGAQPEQALIQFKTLLRRLSPGHESDDHEKRLADQRELILMCIEEYFSDGRRNEE